MIPFANILKYASVAGIVFATWYITSDHYQKRIAEIQLETAVAVQAELFAAAAKTKKSEEQHAQYQLVINSLTAKLNQRVRIHIPVCASRPQDSEDQHREARALSERVDAAFGRLQTGATQLFSRCDQLNIDAIKSNEAQ